MLSSPSAVTGTVPKYGNSIDEAYGEHKMVILRSSISKFSVKPLNLF
jgi:hypothetical protein